MGESEIGLDVGAGSKTPEALGGLERKGDGPVSERPSKAAGSNDSGLGRDDDEVKASATALKGPGEACRTGSASASSKGMAESLAAAVGLGVGECDVFRRLGGRGSAGCLEGGSIPVRGFVRMGGSEESA